MANILLLGLVSFFSDISSEMVYPLIPLYLTAAFGATPALVGIIEGIAESLASLLKVFSGYITDKYHNKKPVAFVGYATGLVYKAALLLAGSWGGILMARVIDRLGKGIRTAPRDALVSESADSAHIGRAFGIHKALDMAGSAIGILAAYLMMSGMTDGNYNFSLIFWVSLLPAVIGLIVMLFVKEKKQAVTAPLPREKFWKRWHELNGNLKLYLAVAFVFTLGNSSNAFLLLRAKSVGFNDTNVVLLYLVYNVVAAVLSVPFGRLSDKIGRKAVLVAGYLAFAAVYAGFAFVDSVPVMIVLFVVYGFYTAMTAGVERALVAEIAPPQLKGTMLGLHATVVGIALLPASALAGVLWTAFGAAAPFLVGAVLSLLAAIVLALFLKRRPRGTGADMAAL